MGPAAAAGAAPGGMGGVNLFGDLPMLAGLHSVGGGLDPLQHPLDMAPSGSDLQEGASVTLLTFCHAVRLYTCTC